MNRFLGLVTASLCFGAALHAGTVSFTVNVNSSSLAGQAGFIDLQFNQQLTGSPLSAIATITNFASTPDFNFNDANNFASTDVTGAFDTEPLTIPNDQGGSNEFAQGVDSFGSSFSFLLTLSGNAIGGFSDAGSEFYITLQDNMANPVVGDSDLGSVANVIVNSDGSVTPQAGSFATIAQTPEPATLWLFLLGAPVLVPAIRCRKR